MRKHLLSICTILSAVCLHAQAPKHEWAKAIGGTGNDRANGIAVDGNGNLIVVGRFQSKTMAVDHLTITKSPEDVDETADIFIIKLDNQGKAIWALSAGGFGDDHAMSSTTDKKGNIYVNGWFESETIRFGDVVLKNNNFTAGKEGVRYNSDMWVAKFGPDGQCHWARNAGGLDGNGHYGKVVLDKKNNVYVAGIAGGEMNFGDGLNLVSVKEGMYLAKYTQDGKLLWAKRGGSPGECQGVAVDNKGNPVAGGFFFEKTTFDNIELMANGQMDAYLVKYNPAGEAVWARRFGGPDGEIASCGTDAFGNCYLGGLYFSRTIQTETDTLVSNGAVNAFLAKYDKDGKLLWARTAGGNNGEDPATATREFHIDHKGNAYCTGSNWSAFTFAGKEIRTVANSEDIILLKYDRDGNEIWAVDYGGKGRNAGRGIATDTKGGVYLTGSFDETEMKMGPVTLNNNGLSDIFIVKLSEAKK